MVAHDAGTGRLKAAIEDLLNHRQLSVEDAMSRHFDPAFRQRTNGVWETYAEAGQRITGLRAVLDHATLTVLDEHVSSDRYAQRHRIVLAMRDGSRLDIEVFVFARLAADGRFLQIDEMTCESA